MRAAVEWAEREALGGRWVVGHVAYEAAPAFDAAMTVRAPDVAPPLAWFASFDRHEAIELGEQPNGATSHESLRAAVWTPEVDEATYIAAVEATRAGIAGGDYYQVNHTLRLGATGDVDPWTLWLRLRAAQLGIAPGAPRGYATYIDDGAWQVACASPELFFARRGRTITTRPMKGTAPRGRWPAEDHARRAALVESAKERAENVMIVDLLRNDLGRIAEPGSVDVPRLFEAERYPGVWQLTSTVTATTRGDVALVDLFAALFPCGSITGAPKVAAMRRIAHVERSPRGPYCGAVGVLAPGGDATFAVGIRTAWRDAATRATRFGTGGGITWDSDPSSEWDEALLKARVLTVEPAASFGLIETFRRDADGADVRIDAHLARMAASARYFGFVDPTPAARRALATCETAGVQRMRLEASADGSVRLTTSPFDTRGTPRWRVALARTPIAREDVFLHHKTTRREIYTSRRDERPDVDDVLLWNAEGEFTEFTIGNVVVEVDGARVTPPRDGGLLGGIVRAELLARGEVVERVVTRSDLARATGVWLVNALRGWVSVDVVDDG